MKTFSRLSLFTLVCVGLAAMLVGNVADVHAQGTASLEVQSIGAGVYDLNDSVKVTFAAQTGTSGAAGITLSITSSANLSGIPNSAVTDPFGEVTVTGTAIAAGDATVTATWMISPDVTQTATAELVIKPTGKNPALIVVNAPDPKSELKIGDTFTQMISIENRPDNNPNTEEFPTLRLSAWQMDVVFNPSILEVVSVEEGDFLESDGADAFFAFVGPPKSPGRISASQARAGQMANADAALPNVAEAPSPAGIALAPNGKGTLLTVTFRVLAVSEEALGIHNVKLQSDEDDDEDGSPDRISYSILVTDVFVATHMSSAKEDVNQDGEVNILDLVMVAGSIGMTPPNPRADVNRDGSVNVLDLVAIYTSDLWATSVDSKKVNDANDAALTAPSTKLNVNAATIQTWIDLAQVEDDGSVIFEQGIANLEALLTSQIPSQTKLLLNYPNPFNPETWIPYQLAKASDVTVMIHSMNGSLIRTLELGHQTAGIYKSKSHAAYWDGRNELGEHVASGLYFYTLTAGKFSATGKMLVRK